MRPGQAKGPDVRPPSGGGSSDGVLVYRDDNQATIVASGSGIDWFPLVGSVGLPVLGSVKTLDPSIGLRFRVTGYLDDASVNFSSVGMATVFWNGTDTLGSPYMTSTITPGTRSQRGWTFDVEVLPGVLAGPGYRNLLLGHRYKMDTVDPAWEWAPQASGWTFTPTTPLDLFPRVGFAVGSGSTGYNIVRTSFQIWSR